MADPNPELNPELEAEGNVLPSENKAFPPTYATHRPRYDADHPVSVLDYIKGCEEVMNACKVTDERVKKKILIHYLDRTTQAVWKSLAKWLTGTYDEFKAEVMSYHPSALREQRGGLAQLHHLCDQFRTVTMARPTDALQFVLRFRAEAAKVAKQGVGNREIVNVFMNTLSETLKEKLWEKLQTTADITVDGELVLAYKDVVDWTEKILRARTVYDERFASKTRPGERHYTTPRLTSRESVRERHGKLKSIR